MQDFNRVEPELILMWRAVCDVVADSSSAVLGEAPRTVIPQADVVEFSDAES